jgi:hypothetical protein
MNFDDSVAGFDLLRDSLANVPLRNELNASANVFDARQRPTAISAWAARQPSRPSARFRLKQTGRRVNLPAAQPQLRLDRAGRAP